MTLVAHFNFELHEMGAKTAFLNGNLEEEVFMNKQKYSPLAIVNI